MKKISILALACMLAACAHYSLAPEGAHTVQGMSFVSTTDWNKSSLRSGAKSEVWTKDGERLNQLTFIGGIKDGQTIFTSRSKELPMPEFRANMLPNELMELVVTSLKNSSGGELVIDATNLRPQRLQGSIGFRFDMSYYDSNGLARRADCIMVKKDDRLNLIIFSAAGMHYYPKEAAEVDSIFSSLQL